MIRVNMSKIESKIREQYTGLIYNEYRRLIRSRTNDELDLDSWEREMVYAEAITNIADVVTTLCKQRRGGTT